MQEVIYVYIPLQVNYQIIVYSSQTYRHVPIALYILLNAVPDDGLMIARNM